VDPFEGRAIVPPLAVDGNALFVATADGRVRAFDSETGVALWQRTGPAATLTATTGLLVARHANGLVAGVDPLTGQPKWEHATGVEGEAATTILGTHIAVAGRGLALLRLDDGSLLWRLELDSQVLSPATLTARELIASFEDGTLRSYDVADGKERWRYATSRPLRASGLVDREGHVFVGTTDGWLLSLGGENGRRRWRWRVGAETLFRATSYRNRVCFASQDAVLYGLDAGSGDLVWRSPLPSRPLAPPILVGKTIVVPCFGDRENRSELVAVDAENGRRSGTHATTAELRGAPVFCGDRFFVGLRDGSLAALTLSYPTPSPSPTPTRAPSPTPTPPAQPPASPDPPPAPTPPAQP
jgi:outer membrane protein assembly factor BamB